MIRALLLSLGAAAARAGTVSYTASSSASQPTAFGLTKRVYVPYGKGVNYAFGMGAAEQHAYDPTNKYAYTVSEQGYINVVDWSTVASAEVKTAWALDLAGAKLTDVALCVAKKLLIVAEGAADTVGAGKVKFFKLIDRAAPAVPVLLKTLDVGPLPDMILPNSDCSKVGVANEGEGKVVNGFLVDPEGSVDILAVTGDHSNLQVTRQSVALGSSTDEQLIAAGVHLPLPLKAQQYWDETYGKFTDVNFTSSREAYTPRTQLEPEYLSWSADDTKLYVNLQENNAIATISVPSSGAASFARIDALQLKDHGDVLIDIKEDSTTAKTTGNPTTVCIQKTYAGFKALRMPDAIQAVKIGADTYIVTANEGDDKEYASYEEKQKLKDIVGSDGSLKSDWTGMTISAAAKAAAALVRADASKMRVTLGSSAIDFTHETEPVFQNVVAMGGRGMSIYKDTGSALELKWDSKGTFEEHVCANYTKSYNGIQDEEFSPKTGSGNALYASLSSGKLKETLDEMNDPSQDGCADGGNGAAGACPLGNTVDERSQKDGAGAEAVVVGTACGSLLAVTATEKQGVCLVWDISNVATSDPTLLFVRHLSEISETVNPGIAYEKRTLGDIDPESMVFLEASDSPTGNAGVMFAGAWSGTLSFWEFTCPSSATTTETSASTSVRAALLALPFLVASLFVAA